MSTPVKKVPIHLQSSQNRLVIRHGQIVNEDGIIDEDVYIEDGIIKQIGKNLIIPGGTRTIDARGKYILPGGIDPHTHFEFDFMGAKSVDDFYQGTKAAVAGGTTMIIDFAFPKPGESILDCFYNYREKADDAVCCDYALHICLPQWSEEVKRDMEKLCKEHGINSFKMFMAYGFMLNDAELYSAFDHCQKLGAVAQVHAENGSIIVKNVEKLIAKGIVGPEGHELSRPEEVEAEAVNRACVIAKQVDCPLYVVHVMSKQASETLSLARSNGTQVYGEALAAGLSKDGSHCKHHSFEYSAGHVLSPPLRSDPTTPLALMNYLAQDVLQTVGSDNCTFNKAQKELGKNDFTKIPNGVNGVEDRMSVVWEKGVHAGIIDLCRFVAITSSNAAKIFNLYPRKGYIGIGSDADIVIWNGNATRTISAKTHHQAVDFNIFEGMVVHGVPEFVIVNGRVIVDDGQLKAIQGFGRFIDTPVFPPFVYDPSKVDELKPQKNHHQERELENIREIEKLHLEEKVCPTPTLPDGNIGTPSCKGGRPEGQRNIQDSTFSISEDLDVERKSCIRVRNPPGGKSTGFW
ncbi:dihydropyrimidinase isoform X1 [Euwallacea similis]|uniref:dihydropyrimidinase isoform X1 n=1 Tax=Euwallacea similis TaxID=1736056 RepID=UPI003450C5BB